MVLGVLHPGDRRLIAWGLENPSLALPAVEVAAGRAVVVELQPVLAAGVPAGKEGHL